MNDLKKAISYGLEVLDDQQLRKVFILVDTLCQARGKRIIVRNGEVVVV